MVVGLILVVLELMLLVFGVSLAFKILSAALEAVYHAHRGADLNYIV